MNLVTVGTHGKSGDRVGRSQLGFMGRAIDPSDCGYCMASRNKQSRDW
ncbi:MAG: hypothetical protein HC881_17705 [Leptolyngbyaceae cyanobacterium SL_7_1]|nr:hypothetical protein [Leptolyngbyaceae cyanobacterium SL_7_1]